MSKLYLGVLDPKKVTPYTEGCKISGCTTFKAESLEDAIKIAEKEEYTSFALITKVWLKGIDYGK